MFTLVRRFFMAIKTYLKTFIFSRYHYKLLLSFLVCTVLPLIIMGFAFYRITYKIVENSILNSIVLVDDQVNIRINNRLNQVKDVSATLQYDMYSLLYKMHNTRDDLSILTNVRDNISLLQSTFNLYHIDIFLDNKNIAASEGLFFHSLDELEKFGIKNILNTNYEWSYKKEYRLPYVLDNKREAKDVIACVNALNNQATGNIDYVYCVLLTVNEFSEMLGFTERDLKGYIVDKAGGVIAHTDSELEGSKLRKEDLDLFLNYGSITEDKNLYYHMAVLDNGWYHVTEIPKEYIYRHVYSLLQTFILIIFISIPIVLVIIFLISKNLTKRIRRLSLAMENFKLGNIDLNSSLVTTVNSDFFDEIDKLGATFLNMQSSINKNMQSILELTLSEEKLKYQLLQSQINPHFLYNILGTIKTCQSIGKVDTANHMISNLTRFYRMSLRKSGEKIKIKDELEISRLYLEMEQICRKDKLSWEINAEDGIENYLICKFTLQPFLENSILHGYSIENTKIHINISVCYGDDEVIVIIEDNGCGIPNDKLEQIRYKLDNHIVDYDQHFGICNVNKRISGNDFGNGSVIIESVEKKGTRIIIKYAQMEENI